MRYNIKHRKSLLVVVFLFCFVGIATDVAKAQRISQSACNSAPVVIDLKNGTVTNSNSQIVVGPFSPTTLGFKSTMVTINWGACTKANIVVEYEGLPSGWTVNLGDSPTNDGYGGDAGSTPAGKNAELWIQNQSLYVTTAGTSPAALDNPLARQDVSLTDSAIKFVVKDQFVSWGGPYSFLQTPNTKRLFATPANGSRIYLGLNQVISNLSRTGSGAARAFITLQ